MPVMEALNTDLTNTQSPQAATDSVPAGVPPPPVQFPRRHIARSWEETRDMLSLLGYPSLEALVDAAVPPQIRLRRPLQLPAARSEQEGLAALKHIASQH